MEIEIEVKNAHSQYWWLNAVIQVVNKSQRYFYSLRRMFAEL